MRSSVVHAHIHAGHAPACSLLNIDLRLLSCSGCKAQADNDRGRQQEAAQQDRSQRSWQCQSQVSPQKEGCGRVGIECFTRIPKTCLFVDCHNCLSSYMYSKHWVRIGFKRMLAMPVSYGAPAEVFMQCAVCCLSTNVCCKVYGKSFQKAACQSALCTHVSGVCSEG